MTRSNSFPAREAVFLALACSTLVGAVPAATLDWPVSRISELPSPDGERTLVIEPPPPGFGAGPELWLKNRSGSVRKRVMALGSSGRAIWFPDSRHFVVADRDSSSSMNSFIYDADGRPATDVRGALLRGDPALKNFESGHFYIEAQRLIDADAVRVAVYGHTDEAPVRCFRFIYSVSRTGGTTKVSGRVSPATATGCDDDSE